MAASPVIKVALTCRVTLLHLALSTLA